MANDVKFTAGMPVWVIERDEDGNAVETSGYVFLAHVEGVVILSSYVNDYDFEGILAYHVQCTAEDYDTHLCVFPDEDLRRHLGLYGSDRCGDGIPGILDF